MAELHSKLTLFEVKKLPAYTEVYIDLPQLFKTLFQNPQDMDLFVQDPQNWISATALALHHLLKSNRIVLPRFYNFLQSTPIKSIMSTDIGKFVSVQGQILQITPVKLQVLKMCYQCLGCQAYSLGPINKPPRFCQHCDSK